MDDTGDNPHHPGICGDAGSDCLVLKKSMNINPICGNNLNCESDKPFSTESRTTSIEGFDNMVRVHLQNLARITSKPHSMKTQGSGVSLKS